YAKKDFSFQVFKDKIHWEVESQGAKEINITKEYLPKFFEVFNKMTSDMTGEQMDQLFSNQMVSWEEKVYDNLLEQAYKLPDLYKIRILTSKFHERMNSLGFEW